MSPDFPIEEFTDDSPHSFLIHFLYEFLAVTLQSRSRDRGVGFGGSDAGSCGAETKDGVRRLELRRSVWATAVSTMRSQKSG